MLAESLWPCFLRNIDRRSVAAKDMHILCLTSMARKGYLCVNSVLWVATRRL